jgi:hypothetical protein
MNAQQLNITHIHQPMPYDLLDMDEPQDSVEYNLSEQDVEDYEWEEFESTDILMELNETQFDSSDY